MESVLWSGLPAFIAAIAVWDLLRFSGVSPREMWVKVLAGALIGFAAGVAAQILVTGGMFAAVFGGIVLVFVIVRLLSRLVS